MFQPFLQLNQKYLDGLIRLKKTFLVSQSYKRGTEHFEDGEKTCLLFSDYEKLAEAQLHFNALKQDNFAAIIDLANEAHKMKIESLFETDSNFKPFWAIVLSKKSVEQQLKTRYMDNVRKWIGNNTNWDIKGSDTVNTQMAVTFGEIFLELKWRSRQIKVKFEDIEKG